MARKIGTWVIGVGCFVAFLGVCSLPAAFLTTPDKILLSAAMTVFSIGMTLVAGGLYVKARTFPAVPAEGMPYPAKRGLKTNCDQCGKYEPVIQCRVHQQQLCADCLADHYDFRACAYVPSTRRSSPKAKAYAQASRG